MATILLIRGEDLTRNSILNGNVDQSKYQSDIKTCQNLYIKPILGKELYDKVCEMYENTMNGDPDGLSGVYEEMYEDYIKEMIIHGTTEIYLSHGAYTISNAGISKLVAQQGATSVDKNEVDFLIQSSRRLYETYRDELLKFLRGVNVPEYKGNCSNVRKNNNIGGWIM